MERLQAILFAVAAAFVLFQAFTGWRLGVVRQLLKIVSLAAAYLGAVFFGDLLLPMLKVTGYPELITRPISAVLTAILCYFIVAFAGRILFKKTTDQGFGTVWLFYGVTGSLLGIVFGLFFVALMAIALRFVGTLATGIAEPNEANTLHERPASRQATVTGLVQIKESLESGMTGSVIRSIDPVPEEAYRVVEKLGRVSSNPAAIQRFFTYPGAAKLAGRPEIASLRDRPEVADALHEGRYLALLTNPSVAKAARNPQVAAIIRDFNLEAALDHALGESPSSEPASSPAPSEPAPAAP